MNICGCNGSELKCFKTGIIIHDERYHPDSRFSGDAYFCPACNAVTIIRANGEYFSSVVPHVVIGTKPMATIWNSDFLTKVLQDYGLDLLEIKP